MSTQNITAAAGFAGRELLGQYLSGADAVGSGAPIHVVNPYNDAPIASFAGATGADVDAAYAAAAEAQPAWAALPPSARRAVLQRASELLEERREEIVEWLVAESGSTRIKANIEVSLAAGITAEAATFPARMTGQIFPSETPGKDMRVHRKPVGVVGVISPWNFPLHLSQRSVAPALALGNAVVIKPSTDTPVTGGLILARLFEEAGLPDGVLGVVAGRGSEIGDAFVEHPTPAMISFTGSTPVGQRVGQLAVGGARLKRVALELGGNSPLVVLDDADLDAAVGAAILGTFLHSGQICMSVNRIIVDSTVSEAFIERFVEAAKHVVHGDPDRPDTLVGPVINDAQLVGLQGKIRLAREQGAKELLSGDIVGRVVPPHIFAGVDPDAELAREEIFGPVVAILEARDEAHALELANHHAFGLSSSVFTRNVDRGERFALRLEAGMTAVNDMPIQDEAHVAFGGERNSGLGRFNGEWAIRDFTTEHTVGIVRTDG